MLPNTVHLPFIMHDGATKTAANNVSAAVLQFASDARRYIMPSTRGSQSEISGT